MIKKLAAEFTGTFFLLLVGTGAMVMNQITPGFPGHLGISIAFGLIITLMIFWLGPVSGAHFNPAVSFGFFLNGNLKKSQLLLFSLAQIAGAICATYLLALLNPGVKNFGMTYPSAGNGMTLLIETGISFVLMMVIFISALGFKLLKPFACLTIGAWVGLAAYYAGPMTGASMNPARSLSPALFSSASSGLWIYLTAPVAGAGLAALFWLRVRSYFR